MVKGMLWRNVAAPLFLSLALAQPGLSVVPQRKFEEFHSEDGIKIEIARDGDSIPWIRGTREFDASVEKIAGILSDFPRYGEIFTECFEKAKVLETKARGARVHVVWRYPFLVRNRDAVPLYHFEKRSGGVFTLSWVDDAKPEDPSEGIRMKMEGEVTVSPEGKTRSRVTYMYLGDIGGDFSQSIKESAWKTQPVHYFRAIQKQLDKKSP